MSQFFKVALLLIAFAGVVYAMRTLRTTETSQGGDPNSPMALLLGSNLRPLNWCPAQTEKIELPVAGKILSDAAGISRFCEIMIDGASQNDVQIEDYQVVAIASGAGQTKKLERNSRGIFRVEGFPFRSDQMQKLFY